MEERELASYGLTEEEARIRRQQGKGNVVSDSGGKSNKQIVVEHLLTYFNLVFLVLAVVLVLAGSSVKNMTFLVIVLINTVIGVVQQIRAKDIRVDNVQMDSENNSGNGNRALLVDISTRKRTYTSKILDAIGGIEGVVYVELL